MKNFVKKVIFPQWTGSGQKANFTRSSSEALCKRYSTCPGNLFQETERFLNETKRTKFVLEKTPRNLRFGDFFRQKSRNCLLNVQRCFCEITNYFENNTIKMSFRRFCANLFQVLQKRYFAALSTQQCTCPGDDFEWKKSLTKINFVHFWKSSGKRSAFRQTSSVMLSRRYFTRPNKLFQGSELFWKVYYLSKTFWN